MISRVSIGSSVSVYMLSCLFLFGLNQINHAEGIPLSKLICPLPGIPNYKCVTLPASMTRTRLHDAKKILCMTLKSELSKNKCLKIFPVRARWNFNNTHIWTNNRCNGIFKICYRPYVNIPQTCPISGNPNQNCTQVYLNKKQEKVISEAGFITCMREKTSSIYDTCWRYGQPLYSYTEKSVRTSGQCQGAFKVCHEEYERNEPECPDPSSDTTCETVRISGPQKIRIQKAESITCIKMVKEFSSSRCWRKGERKYYYEGFNVWSTNGCDLTARVCYQQYSREEPACPGTSSDDLTCEIAKVNGPNKRRIEKAQNISCISMVKETSLDKCWKYGVRQYYFDDVNVWSVKQCSLDVKICYIPYVNTPMECPIEAGSRGPEQCVNVNLPNNSTRTIDGAEKITCMAETQLMERCWRYGQPRYSFTDDAVKTLPGCHGEFKVCYYESCSDGKLIVKRLFSHGNRHYNYRIAEASSIRSMEVKQRFSGNCKFRTSFGISGNSVWVRSGCKADFKICIIEA